jgi:antitoxin HigA-1
MGITQYRLTKEISVPQRRIGEIVAGKRAITTDTEPRLSRFFGTNEGFGVGLQINYDVEIARDKFADTLDTIQPWKKNPQAVS